MSSRLAANSLASKLPKTHSPGDTGKGGRSPPGKSHSVLCGFRGAGHPQTPGLEIALAARAEQPRRGVAASRSPVAVVRFPLFTVNLARLEARWKGSLRWTRGREGRSVQSSPNTSYSHVDRYPSKSQKPCATKPFRYGFCSCRSSP
jgi:hypothetical protein